MLPTLDGLSHRLIYSPAKNLHWNIYKQEHMNNKYTEGFMKICHEENYNRWTEVME